MTVDQVVKTSLKDQSVYWSYLGLQIIFLIMMIFITIGMFAEQMTTAFIVGIGILSVLLWVVSSEARKQKQKIDRGYEISPAQYYTLKHLLSEFGVDSKINKTIRDYMADGIVTQGEYDHIIKITNMNNGSLHKKNLLKEIHKTIEVI